jgi:hypothetical protein
MWGHETLCETNLGFRYDILLLMWYHKTDIRAVPMNPALSVDTVIWGAEYFINIPQSLVLLWNGYFSTYNVALPGTLKHPALSRILQLLVKATVSILNVIAKRRWVMFHVCLPKSTHETLRRWRAPAKQRQLTEIRSWHKIINILSTSVGLVHKLIQHFSPW